MGRRCLFPWCKSSRLLHAFPRDAVRSKLWLRAVGWPSTTNTSKLFVCSKHFSRESYENWRKVDFGLAPEGSLRLSEDAVPRPEDFSIPSKAVCILFNHNSFDLSCVLLRTCIHNLR